MTGDRGGDGAGDGVVVVVLAGGAGRRFAGAGPDKVAAPLDGRSLLDHLLAGLPPQLPVVVVGPPRPTARPVTTTR
ncbi:NTP transferase domain-containing protein, partial [Kineococcus glutinatus]|uniref:NTP transferase domain-containing protein n=1 Tax=Kineococcus glutinatus TaxID=1070872 RepID=UPI0031F1B8E7